MTDTQTNQQQEEQSSPKISEVSYPDMVSALIKPGISILHQITPEKLALLHSAMGIAGEAGEIVDAIKKNAIYNKPLDFENLLEELGDMEFYLEDLRQQLGVTREEILRRNQEKLSVRYHKGTYSDQQAQQRADKQ